MLFCAYMVFSKYGDIRLGQKPDYNYVTWITMLFSAGIGIGLYFWGVQEPVYHYATLNRHNHMYIDPASTALYDAALEKFGIDDGEDGAKVLDNVATAWDLSPPLAWTKQSRTLRAIDGMNISIFNW